jgi:tRNA A-37 threonylcarbamoyl transferase component Bud32
VDVAVGHTVAGRYRLIDVLGRGGTGTVWRAEDQRLGRQVAVKEVLLPRTAPAAEQLVLRERTLREARAASRLHHPGVVTVYDVVEADGRPWIVMQLVEARTLSDLVRDQGALSPEATARVGLAVLEALDAAHRSGVVHRDVKPSNIMVAADGRVTLTDFGIAQAHGDPSLTSTGLLVGSPRYVSPERVEGRPAGPAADLWGLGATLFFAVEGRSAYEAPDAISTLLGISRGERAAYVRAGALAPVLDGLLEPDPARRSDVPTAARGLRGVLPADERDDTDEIPLAPRPLPTPPVATAAPVRALPPPVRAPRPAPAPRTPAAAPARDPQPVAVRRRRLPRAALAATGLAVAAAAAVVAVATQTGQPAQPTPSAGQQGAGGPAVAGGLPPTAAGLTRSLRSPDAAAPSASTTSASTTALPLRVTDRAGWTLSLPAGWTEVKAPQGERQWRDPQTDTTVLVDYQPAADPDPVGAWERQETSSRPNFPGYQRLSIAPVAFRGFPAADWEFTYTGGHGLDRGFAAHGHGHALFLQSRPDQWAAARRVFDQIAAAFQPAP